MIIERGAHVGDDADRYHLTDQGFVPYSGTPGGIDRFPMEPPEGTVLRYLKQFPRTGRMYSYVAVRAGGQWYQTRKDFAPVAWVVLREDIGEWPCFVVTEWGEIPAARHGACVEITSAVRIADLARTAWYRDTYQVR